MDRSNHLLRINETKRHVVRRIMGNKIDAVEASSDHPAWSGFVKLEPTHPKKFDFLRGQSGGRVGEGGPAVKDADDPAIPIRMAIVGCLDHNVGVGSRVDGVLSSPHVVSCVVHPQNFVRIDSIFVETNGIILGGCEEL